MFTPPRFVVVDDTLSHLTAILEIFQRVGSPCIGIHFKPDLELNPAQFRGVRGLFLDLHMLGGELGTDHRRHYALIASILEDNIHRDGGPFILIIWTQLPHLRDELSDYLDQNLDREKPFVRPLTVLSLDKAKFINLDTGEGDHEVLRAAVDELLGSNPQISALINWETDVLAAAGATLSALLDLVALEDKVSTRFSPALDVILSRLALASAGSKNAATDVRAAINGALIPILADRVMNRELRKETRELWDRAITQHIDPKKLPAINPSDAARVNRMLHVAMVGPGETISPTSWGAVLEFPAAWWDEAGVLARYGMGRNDLLSGQFKIPPQEQVRCKPRLVRIGAACDYAQGQPGPLTYLFGLEIPESIRRNSTSPAEWRSPAIQFSNDPPVFLCVNVRFAMTLPSADGATLVPVYRLREQLLMHLISHTSVHLARPGTISL